MTGYGALYIAALIVAATLIFSQTGLQVSGDRPSAWRALAGAVVAAVLIGAAASLQAVREVRYPEPPPTQESLYLTSGATARRLSIGYSALAADLYWIRAIQYYGDTKLRLDQTRTRQTDRRIQAAGRLRAAVPAARPDDDARSAVQHRVSVWLDFSRRAVSGRRGPSGSGHRAARKGIARTTR